MQLKDTAGYFELALDCSTFAIRYNCDNEPPCLWQGCGLAFGTLGLPDLDTARGISGSAIGLVLESPGKDVAIGDFNDQLSYDTHHIRNNTGDGKYAKYNLGFEISKQTPSPGTNMQGKVYIIHSVNIPDSALALYLWKADSGQGGAWVKKADRAISLRANKFCRTAYYNVTEIGIYMVSDSVVAPSAPLQMRMKKRFRLMEGYITNDGGKHSCPAIELPISKNRRIVTCMQSVDDNARIIAVFEKGDKQFILDRDLKSLPRNRKGIMRIKKALLEKQAINDPAKVIAELGRKYYSKNKGGCDCVKH
jgi:hypothetical protein